MSTLKLYKNFPINGYNNQFYITSKSTRNDLFDRYTDLTINNLSCVDKSRRIIRVLLTYEQAMNYNYGVFIENGKRYYFFINDIEYISNNVVSIIHFDYDYFQTYFYDVTIKKSYVEREHVTNDTFGEHIIDEGLPISDYIIANRHRIEYNDNEILFCVTVSDNTFIYMDGQFTEQAPLFLKSGTGIEMCTVGFEKSKDAFTFIDLMVSSNKIDSIQAFYCANVPTNQRLYVWIGDSPDAYYTNGYQVIPNTTYEDYSINRLSTIDEYSPNNNKCFLYPYNLVNVSNNLGNSIKGKFEFSDNKEVITFSSNFPTAHSGTPNGFFKNYNNVVYNLDYLINGMSNQDLPYITNTYSAYYSANLNTINNSWNIIERNYNLQRDILGNNLKSNAITSGINYLSGNIGELGKLAGGDISGAAGSQLSVNTGILNNAISTYYGTKNQVNQINVSKQNAQDTIKASLADVESKGDVAHGSFNPSALTNLGHVGFIVQTLQVKKECIKVIDDYLSMFGYKVNTVKIPNLNSRNKWNFVKTLSVNVIGNVPQVALDVIKNMFDTGTTLWHDLGGMYDYDFKANSIN